MSLWKYRYFVDVVELKSFTKAGKKNFITQTAVSQQIADLEKKIGGRLLERESGALTTTELGRIVYAKAKQILQLDEQMKREIDAYKEAYVIKIGVDSSIDKSLWVKLQDMVDTYYSEDDFRFAKIDNEGGGRMMKEYMLDIFIGYDLAPSCREPNIASFVIDRSRTGVYVGDHSTIGRSGSIPLERLRGYKRYMTTSYPCSCADDSSEDFRRICKTALPVNNVETMKLKVEFNDGYAFADSHYFSYCTGQMLFLSNWEQEQCLRVYYRKNKNKTKLTDVLQKLKSIARTSE